MGKKKLRLDVRARKLGGNHLEFAVASEAIPGKTRPLKTKGRKRRTSLRSLLSPTRSKKGKTYSSPRDRRVVDKSTKLEYAWQS